MHITAQTNIIFVHVSNNFYGIQCTVMIERESKHYTTLSYKCSIGADKEIVNASI